MFKKTPMLKNHFLIAWRSLFRTPTFSLINILGLALGLACSLLILLWVQDERKVDSFHPANPQLYQVYERNFFNGSTEAGYATQGLLAQEVKRVIPEVQYASGLEYAAAPGTQNTFRAGNKAARMTGLFAGPDFLKMFHFPLRQGKVETALDQPATIAVSNAMAGLYFGSAEQALGKTIRFDNREDLRITAVFEDLPSYSSLQFDFLRSWTDFVKQNEWVNNWGNASPQTFIQLRPGANAAAVQGKLKDFVYNYRPKTDGPKTELALQPFGERYLYSAFKDGYSSGGRIEYVRLFSLIALFIVFIACINFMNLTTARSARRAREIGVRKVLGAPRLSLIGQFIAEALLVTLLAILIALALAWVSLPAFNQLTGKSLLLPLGQRSFWLTLGGLLVLTGLVAGGYPAFFLSAVQPVRVLKGALTFSGSNLFLRQGLVVFQFALSVILIIAAVVVYRQMQYVQEKNLGYDRTNLLYIPIEGELAGNYELFKQEALRNTAVAAVSKMRNSPTFIEHHTGDIGWPAKDPNLNVSFADGVVGYDFVKTMNLQLLTGRDFSRAFADSLGFLLNETAVKKMGFTDPIGQKITWGSRAGTVIGVVRDFHFTSLHQTIEPLVLRLDEKWTWGTLLVRLRPGQTKQAIASLQTLCSRLNPGFPFTYQFSDLEYGKLYNGEQVVGKLAGLFACLAIVISCLGLFGLATFTARQRNKEIGIRKVLGASAGRIAAMLAVNFLKPVVVAFLIAFPAAGFAMHVWLQGFAYRAAIGWWVFGGAALAAVVIALVTVSFHSVKTALVNPVKSLRTE